MASQRAIDRGSAGKRRGGNNPHPLNGEEKTENPGLTDTQAAKATQGSARTDRQL
jgi:hypothetical protein